MGERTRTVAVRLTPAEHAVWEAAAVAAGRGRLGSWVRDEVAARLAEGGESGTGAGRRSRVKATPSEPAAAGEMDPAALAVWSMSSVLNAELPRMGNNLNQAVRALNVQARHGHGADGRSGDGRGVEGQVLAQLQEALVEVRAVLAVVRKHTSGEAAAGAAGAAATGAAAGAASGAVAAPARRKASQRAARTAPEKAPRAADARASRRTPGSPQAPADPAGNPPVNRWTTGGGQG
ncbi:hypothetical protein [Kineococcus sp. SYSU DK004]|uniref:hypothetical protein n=1 Tax=Kineococcus sp. SYSU DK004 TaxID=3383125 RepID=UPI003D7CCCA9